MKIIGHRIIKRPEKYKGVYQGLISVNLIKAGTMIAFWVMPSNELFHSQMGLQPKYKIFSDRVYMESILLRFSFNEGDCALLRARKVGLIPFEQSYNLMVDLDHEYRLKVDLLNLEDGLYTHERTP